MGKNIKHVFLFEDSINDEKLSALVESTKNVNDPGTMLMSGVTGLKIIDLENYLIYVISEEETKIISMMTGIRGYPVVAPQQRPQIVEEEDSSLSHNALAS